MKAKKQSGTRSTKQKSQESVNATVIIEKVANEKSGQGDGVRDETTRGPEAPATNETQLPSFGELFKSISSLTEGLKSVKENHEDLVQVMMAAGGEPYFPKGKGKGVGKRSAPRDKSPATTTRGESPANTTRGPQAPPPEKKQRRAHTMSDDDDYDDDYYHVDNEDSEPEFTSDEVENQIDEFLKTATETVFKKSSLPPVTMPGPSGCSSQAPAAAASAEFLVEDVLDEGLSTFAQDLATDEDLGPEVAKQLADIMTNLLGKKLSDEKIKTRIDENPPPSNIPLLHPPRVNECVWELLKAGPRSSDIRMRKIQVRLTRGLVALARLADLLLQHKKKGTVPDLAESLNRALQSFALIANANYEISLRRRETLRGQLNPKFNRLCYPSTPVTENLFGDDITKRVEDINKVQRLGADLGQGYRGRYNGGGRGYGRGFQRGRGRGSPSYRGQRGTQPKNWRGRGSGAKNNNNRQ